MSNLTLWGPRPALFDAGFGGFDTAFDGLIRRAFGGSEAPAGEFTPAAEVVRDGDDAVVRLELPGVDVAKDVTIEVEGRRLVVHGERRDEHDSEAAGRTLREVRYGSFRRVFALPAGVSAEAVTAGYRDGVLSVRVAGAHADKPVEGSRRIEIATGSSAS